ncbi:MAG: sigma-70 family RNA polymerase sigma factor [Phycisphaeraceae bacterium]
MVDRARQIGDASSSGSSDRPEAGDRATEDARLLAHIADGSEAALAQLYDRYSPMVLALALRIVHDRGEAEDVLVDVFHELWTRSSRYNPARGSVLNYLSLLTRSRALDRRRRLARGPVSSEAGNTAADRDPGPPEAVWLDERREQVRRALARLRPEQRAALELVYFEGLTQAQVAQRLDQPLGTIKTRIRTGLIQLRDLLRNLP